MKVIKRVMGRVSGSWESFLRFLFKLTHLFGPLLVRCFPVTH